MLNLPFNTRVTTTASVAHAREHFGALLGEGGTAELLVVFAPNSISTRGSCIAYIASALNRASYRYWYRYRYTSSRLLRAV